MSTEPTALPAAVVAAIDEYGVTCANVVKMRTSPEWENWAREKLEAAILLALTHAPASAPGGSTDGGQEPNDTTRLDWWEKNYNDGPSLGFFTDGVLGLGRGHIVETKWTVKGKACATLRDAIDAAMSKEPSHA